MATVEVNGHAAVSGRIELPREGAWQADLVVDYETALEGVVVVSLGSLELCGTVQRGGLYGAANYVHLVGGAAGMGELARVWHYRHVQASKIVADLLAAAGESLDSSGDPALLSTSLEAWTVVSRQVGGELRELIDTLVPGAVWRVSPAGLIWIGSDAWPEADVGDYTTTSERPGSDELVIASDEPTLLPGYSLDGQHVDRVVHTLDGSGIRTVVTIAE